MSLLLPQNLIKVIKHMCQLMVMYRDGAKKIGT